MANRTFRSPGLSTRDLSTLLGGKRLKNGEDVAVRFPNGNVLLGQVCIQDIPGQFHLCHVYLSVNGAPVFVAITPGETRLQLARVNVHAGLRGHRPNKSRRGPSASRQKNELARRLEVLEQRERRISARSGPVQH
jgi:hypothetical protein